MTNPASLATGEIDELINGEAISRQQRAAFPVVLEAIRAKHWVKNFFLFAPLLFSVHLLDGGMFFKSATAFISFSLTASGVYLINDLADAKEDVFHPVKKTRPIASGELRGTNAVLLSSGFLLSGLILALLINPQFALLAGAYVGLNLAYSLWLKHLVIIDVLALSGFYLLRVVAGGVAIGVHLSNWLLVCTFLLALFMGFGKRRHELTLLNENAYSHRKILAEYSPYFLDQMIAVITPATLVAYSLYTMSPETVSKFQTDKLPLTIPFVLYGIFRYLYLVHQRQEGGDPAKILLTDKPLLITVGAWVLAVFIVLYVL